MPESSGGKGAALDAVIRPNVIPESYIFDPAANNGEGGWFEPAEAEDDRRKANIANLTRKVEKAKAELAAAEAALAAAKKE